MSERAPAPMTSDEFLAWAGEQPDGARYELVDGHVVQMAAERAVHARMKFRIARQLFDAVQARGLPCEVFGDGMAVVIDPATTYEPDALLRCGPALPDDAVRITDPMIVVEIVSPSSRSLDSGAKLADYFRLPSLRHYLIVRTQSRTIIQHSRTGDGTILTRIVSDGTIRLDPPGIRLEDLFEKPGGLGGTASSPPALP